ncbi:nicotinate-nucleotide--dimethylbenzimidazole phosphoribosyltransferase [Butyrivibrio sp. INlla14]|uniref:nicotinate-nucleotide--dimethylbenzimidazole phosphoribosyltransferase n=1 Tax=Butyrivibrio sp. INlla14 TaxID=1520808 RepID=UPI00087640FB|nr:nicotinate-nucleotide--dimethylbenzimidazole phosphoribosyltransferase [Butyrivibrio sp. INlla14]SCY02410.1 nicotinate-nucleotide-dimethylbenzimidazole phosphoribosyltransferase [Butyrivibrio sp. INlla14]
MIYQKKDLYEIKIERPDEEVYKKAKDTWDQISKPIDGLGDFESLICRIAAMKRDVSPRLDKRSLVIMCADNGIVEEGISQSGKEITLAVAKALGKGISSACSIGRTAKVEVYPVDIGIDSDEKLEGVFDKKVSKGSRNFLKEPAMSMEQTLEAVFVGIETAQQLSKDGKDILAVGEMGIGNTTTSAAVLSALLGGDSDEFVGRGAGLDDAGLLRKKEVVKRALSKYDFGKYKDNKDKCFEILRTLGGYDIAGMVGVFIGAAKCHLPVVIDGVISSTAALLAEGMVPGCREYMIPSHKGREAGNLAALKALGFEPYINGNMALGEGTGALMLFPILDLVLDYYLQGAKFSDYKIEEYKRFD